MAKKQRDASTAPDWRINIKIRDAHELALYRDMKARAAKQGVSLHDFVFALFQREADRI